jgi:hypothetical protein
VGAAAAPRRARARQLGRRIHVAPALLLAAAAAALVAVGRLAPRRVADTTLLLLRRWF